MPCVKSTRSRPRCDFSELCGLQVYLDDRNNFSTRRSSPTKTFNFKRSADCGSAALFSVLVIGLLGLAPFAQAQAPAGVKSTTCSAVTLISPGTAFMLGYVDGPGAGRVG